MAKFVAYLPVSFPNYSESIQAFKMLVDSGADVIEVGVPYSDPVMDGITIQQATKTAILNGFKISDVFRAVEEIRIYSDRQFELGAINRKVEIYVMCYYNIVFHYGLERFAGDLKDVGLTGVIIPDLIPDEAQKWIAITRRNGLKAVFLTAPNSNDARLDLITSSSSGFIYATSLLGVTGERDANDRVFTDASKMVQRVRDSLLRVNRDTPVYLGLGVSNANQAGSIASFADGVIVGSKLVNSLKAGKDELYSTAKALASSINSGKRPGVGLSFLL